MKKLKVRPTSSNVRKCDEGKKEKNKDLKIISELSTNCKS